MATLTETDPQIVQNRRKEHPPIVNHIESLRCRLNPPHARRGASCRPACCGPRFQNGWFFPLLRQSTLALGSLVCIDTRHCLASDPAVHRCRSPSQTWTGTGQWFHSRLQRTQGSLCEEEY